MKKGLVAPYKSIFQLGAIAGIFSASIFGCAPSPTPFPLHTPISSNPQLTRTAELIFTEDRTTLSSPVSTALPTGDSSVQSSKTATLSSTALSTISLQTQIPLDGIVRQMLEQVNIERALSDLKKLTGETPLCIDNRCTTIVDRETGNEGLDWAKVYVFKELVDLGYSVEYRDWSHSGFADQNIKATKPGVLHPEEEVYFVAHLDGIKSGPAAVDNASGVVDLLEMARVLSKYTFSRTVVLFFSTGEEHGVLGARSYVDQISPEGLRAIKFVVNVDMIGYDADRDRVMQLWAGDHPPSLAFAQSLSDLITQYHLDLIPRTISGCN